MHMVKTSVTRSNYIFLTPQNVVFLTPQNITFLTPQKVVFVTPLKIVFFCTAQVSGLAVHNAQQYNTPTTIH